MRTRAIAESLTLTRSTPASPRRRAASIVRSIRIERGGSISTDTTNRRSASAAGQPGRRRLFADRPIGAPPGGRASSRRPSRRRCAGRPPEILLARRGRRRARCASPRRARASCRSSRRRSTRRAPASRGTIAPKYVGAGGVDEPALDALRQPGVRHDRAAGRRGGRADPVSASRQPNGPAPQFTPIASTPASASAGAAASGRRAVGRHELLAERHLGHDRQVGGAARLVDGEQEMDAGR